MPVIATAVGGIPELIGDENGFLIPPQNDAALTAAMVEIYQNYTHFQPRNIASAAQKKFSMQTIGAAFSDLYNQKNQSSYLH